MSRCPSNLCVLTNSSSFKYFKIDEKSFALDHKKELETSREILAQRFKTKAIDIEAFKRDLSRIDFIENVQDLRINLGLINNAPGTMPSQNLGPSSIPDKTNKKI